MREGHCGLAAKQASTKANSPKVFGQARKPAKMFRAGLYARVSTNDQQTIPLQIRALREYAVRVRAGLAHAQQNGMRLGRPPTATIRVSSASV